ncbi:MAG TPA: DUF5615 family PIN-like protein [Candidatus Obscuribacterales bacterium]
MKFLTDQDVYGSTVQLLMRLGHDVATVAQLGLSQATDKDILDVAQSSGRILVTRDRDFGALIFVQRSKPGVIYLRILPSTQNAVHAELERILQAYSVDVLLSSFMVVEPSRHRLRKSQSP